MVVSNNFNKEIVELIKNGGIGVIPTDTIYGLVGLALNKNSVQRLYEIKGRDKSKPFIILISDISDLNEFGVSLNDNHNKLLQKYWPGKLSAIIPFSKPNKEYLSRGFDTLSFRLPDDEKLIELLHQTGPLVAQSANPEGKPPAENQIQIKDYFDGKIDFSVDGGTLIGSASTLIDLTNPQPKLLRQGDVVI
jgi:L-threonylcarbamoyladenylate synthase